MSTGQSTSTFFLHDFNDHTFETNAPQASSLSTAVFFLPFHESHLRQMLLCFVALVYTTFADRTDKRESCDLVKVFGDERDVTKTRTGHHFGSSSRRTHVKKTMKCQKQQLFSMAFYNFHKKGITFDST